VITTIHQPENFPHIGFFNKMSKADTFIILDNVQYRKNYFQNRNQIINTKGVPEYVTTPVQLKGHMSSNIADIRINNDIDWSTRNLKQIYSAYKDHPYFDDCYPDIEKLLNHKYDRLIELNMSIISYFMHKLSLQSNIVYASDLPSNEGHKTDLLVNLCKSVGTSVYIAGNSGKDYLEVEKFNYEGIYVASHEYTPIPYSQYSKDNVFVPFMSTLDAVMNIGFEETSKLVRLGGISEDELRKKEILR